MTDPLHPPPNPDLLRALIDHDRPLSEVRNMDDTSQPVRLIRLHAPNAARWCYATSVGSYEMYAPEVPSPMRTPDGGAWVCGPWMARQTNPRRPSKEEDKEE